MLTRLVSIFCIAAALAYSQTQTPNELLHGLVVNVHGDPLAGVTVTAKDKQGQGLGTATTSESGEWRLAAPAGHYQLDFTLSGFHPVHVHKINAPGVVTLFADTRADATESITYKPVVDPERTQQEDVVSSQQLLNLPVNERNYLDLALLTPGVTSTRQSTSAWVGLSPANNPQSGLSIGGNDGRGNIFWLDGGENYINTGGVRTSISQEAVAEFQIERSSFSAEFGGGLGGIINIISRSGSGTFHGDAFGFLRQKELAARNYFDPGNSPLTRVQTGFTAGGPIKRSKYFYFGAFEFLDRHESAFVDLFRTPSDLGGLTASQQALLPYLGALGPVVGQALNPLNYPSTIQLLSKNNGVFPVTEKRGAGSIRIDHNVTDNDQLFVRLNSTIANSSNTNLQSFVGGSQGDKEDLHDATLLINNNLVLNSRLVGETRLSGNYYDSFAKSQDPFGPEFQIAGSASLNRDPFLPTKLRELHGQFQQNFFYTPGKHSIRFGADINPVRSSPSVAFREGGQFIFAKALPLGALLDQFTGIPGTANQIAQSLLLNGRPDLLSSLSEPISALQAFNLGLPLTYLQSFGSDSFVRWTQRYNFFINDVFKATPQLTLNFGLRYELELNKDLPNSFTNLAPRIGFAWSPGHNRRTVIRSGYGIFFQKNLLETLTAAVLFPTGQLQLLEVPITGIPGSHDPRTGQPVTSADLYQTLSAEGLLGRGTPITAEDLAQFGIMPGSNPYPIKVSIDKAWQRPYSEQASFEIEHALGSYSVSAAFNYNRALHLPRERDTNLAYGPPNPDGSPTFVPLDPTIALNNVFQPRGNSYYTAFLFQVLHRFSERLTLDAHYVLSRAIDDATQIGDLPNNSLDVKDDRGLASFQQKHRFVASAVIVPFKWNQNQALRRVLGGFLFSPVVVAGSGLPFNVETGIEEGQRPYGIGRNTGQGPSYASFDMRLSRSFRLAHEGLAVEFIAEGFNILNRTNFSQLNNIVGNIPASQIPRPFVGVRGNPQDPFSFTSANPPRQIQIALRLRW